MEEAIETIFGHHSLSTWIGVIIWSCLILFTYKIFNAPSRKQGFTWKYFFNDNTRDFMLNMLISFLILRLGDTQIHKLFNWIKGKFSEDIPLDGEGMDIVILVSLLSVPVSVYLHHKWRKPISKKIEEEMHVHNENCGHT